MSEQLSAESSAGVTLAGEDKLTLVSKFSYGLGDFASQLMWSLASSYLVLFYTDNVGISAATAGTILLVARILDAIFDPMLGAFAERHPTRHGRFRPWLLYGAPVLAVTAVMSFTTVPGGTTGKVVWACGTYLLMGFMYSAVNLPYGALSSVMTRNSQERVSLNAYRFVGTYGGMLALSALTMPLVLWFSGVGDGRTTNVKGYTITAVVMAVVAVPLFWIVFANCKEVIKVEPEAVKVPLRTTFGVVLGNKPLMLVTLTFFFMLVSTFSRLGVAVYYCIYLMHRVDLVSWVMSLPSATGMLGIMLLSGVSRRMDKRVTVLISAVVMAVPLCALFFVDPENVTLVMILVAVYGVGNFAAPVIMSMIPDSIDYAEDLTGVRTDGTAYAAFSLASKIASAVGAAIGAFVLGLFGYVANQQTQSPHATLGVNIAVNLVPAALCVVAMIPLALYPLNAKKNQEIQQRLAEKRALAGS